MNLDFDNEDRKDHLKEAILSFGMGETFSQMLAAAIVDPTNKQNQCADMLLAQAFEQERVVSTQTAHGLGITVVVPDLSNSDKLNIQKYFSGYTINIVNVSLEQTLASKKNLDSMKRSDVEISEMERHNKHTDVSVPRKCATMRSKYAITAFTATDFSLERLVDIMERKGIEELYGAEPISSEMYSD